MLIVSDYSSNEARILETTRMSTGWEPEATADRRARADLSGYRLPPGGLMHPQGGIPFGGSSLKDYGTVDNMRTATLMIEKAAGALAFCSRRLQGNPQLVKFAMQMPDWQDEYERYVSPLMMQTVQTKVPLNEAGTLEELITKYWRAWEWPGGGTLPTSDATLLTRRTYADKSWTLVYIMLKVMAKLRAYRRSMPARRRGGPFRVVRRMPMQLATAEEFAECAHVQRALDREKQEQEIEHGIRY